MGMMYTALFLVTALVGYTHGHSSGAPIAACIRDGVPNHDINAPQQSTSPYILMKGTGPQLLFSRNTPIPYIYQPNEQISVHLITQDDHTVPFKGFFIRAIDYTTWEQTRHQNQHQPDEFEDKPTVGSFKNGNPHYKSYTGCAAITHLNADPKGHSRNQVSVLWTAPRDFSGEVYFEATVVQNYTLFWTGLVA